MGRANGESVDMHILGGNLHKNSTLLLVAESFKLLKCLLDEHNFSLLVLIKFDLIRINLGIFNPIMNYIIHYNVHQTSNYFLTIH